MKMNVVNLLKSTYKYQYTVVISNIKGHYIDFSNKLKISKPTYVCTYEISAGQYFGCFANYGFNFKAESN